jgi:hypothetical protein
MKRISAALAVAALAVGAAPAAAEPGLPGTTFPERPAFPERPTLHNSPRDSDTDGTMAFILGGVLLFVVIAGPLFGAESRPAWLNVDRKPSFRMVGSMRPEDWPPSEFKR